VQSDLYGWQTPFGAARGARRPRFRFRRRNDPAAKGRDRHSATVGPGRIRGAWPRSAAKSRRRHGVVLLPESWRGEVLPGPGSFHTTCGDRGGSIPVGLIGRVSRVYPTADGQRHASACRKTSATPPTQSGRPVGAGGASYRLAVVEIPP
jgi:hypothetical protein